MTIDTLLTVGYLACFQLCAIPGIVRIVRLRSSQTSSSYREALLILGASLQLVEMLRKGAVWNIWLSPVMTLCSVTVLLAVIVKYRRS